MPDNKPSSKELTDLINNIMGHPVLNQKQFEQIMQGAKKAKDRGGMSSVIEYLMKVTQADVDKDSLKKFANKIQDNPKMGLDILHGKKKIDPKKG